MSATTSTHTSRGVLVTGGSRGIGRAIATAFARRSDRVAVHYGTRRADAEATVGGLDGSGHATVAGDLAEPLTARRVVNQAVAALGLVDILVNKAAQGSHEP